MSVAIQVQDAQLKTLTVEIRALTVSGKQMTLAVFRQLPIGTIYADSGDLLPHKLWGLVRYWIDADGHGVWAVYESEGILYRSGIVRPPRPDSEIHARDVQAITAAISLATRDIEQYSGFARNEEGNKDYWNKKIGEKKEVLAGFLGKEKILREREAGWILERAARIKSAEILNALPQLFIAV